MDTINPTPELLKQYPDHDQPKQTQEQDQQAHKINQVVDRLRRNGDITADEHDAAWRYYRDFTKGMHIPGLVGGYGERVGSSTPLSQLDNGSLTPAERRTFHHTRAVQALQSIDHLEQRQMIVKCIIDEVLLHEASQQVFGGSRNTAAGAGKYALILGIRALKQHYDRKYTK